MIRLARCVFGLMAVLVMVAGCSKQEKKAHLSGKVTFKGKPVPAGYISFMPDVTGGNQGQVKVVQIKDGEFNTALEKDAGISPGACVIRIAGFDGKPIPYYPQEKQIFNPHELRDTIPEGSSSKEFSVPASAADNLRIEPTADIP